MIDGGAGCGLCEAAHGSPDGENKFFVLICRTCGNPMIVLFEHRAKLTAEEQYIVDEIAARWYPKRRRRGYIREIRGHFHEHLIE